MHGDAAARAQSRRKLFLLLFAILLVKAIFFALDHQPGFYFGDSGSYLETAFVGWIPPDRSFLYGYLLRLIIVWPHSIALLLPIQTLLSALAAWFLGLVLMLEFRTRFAIAAIAALLCAIEPLQLLSERYVMTEAVATFLFASYFWLNLIYLRTGRATILVAAQFIGVCLMVIRFSFLPMVITFPFVVPLLSPVARQAWHLKSWRQALAPVATHFCIGVLVSQSLLFGYKLWYGSLVHQPPAISSTEGLFLLSWWAPIVEPIDYPIAAEREALFRYPSLNRRDLYLRDFHRFDPDGLCARLENRCQKCDERTRLRTANDLARDTAVHAAMRNPMGVIKLAWLTFMNFLRETPWGGIRANATWDEGWSGAAPANTIRELKTVHYVLNPYQDLSSLTKKWHREAVAWYRLDILVLALSPLFLLLTPAACRPQILLCVIAALFFLIGATVTAANAVPRFLTTGSWIVLLLLATVIGRRHT